MLTIRQARSWYPAIDPVHGFDHVLRVYYLAEEIGRAEGADLQIVRAAVLLHDARDPQMNLDEQSENRRQAHHHHSAAFAAQILQEHGWEPRPIQAVQECIRSHRFRDHDHKPVSLEARVLFDADKLDAIGAVGVARAIAYAVRAGMPFYARPSLIFLERGQLEASEPHSAYHEFLYKLIKIKDRLYTPTGRKLAETRQQIMVTYFQALAEELQAYPTDQPGRE